MNSARKYLSWRSALLLAFGALVVLRGVTAEQRQALQASNFVVKLESYPPPHEAQPKTLLEGATSEVIGNIVPVTGAKLSTFKTNGAPEIVAETPQCFFDPARRLVSSPDAMRIRTADGIFLLEGRGFSLPQTNLLLTVSNRVRTVILMSDPKHIFP